MGARPDVWHDRTMSYPKFRNLSLVVLACAALTAGCGRSDATIQEDVQTRLTTDAALEGVQISATAKDGVVVLSGEADTQEQQERAVQVAREVEGVKDVMSEITVEDERVSTAVEEALAADSLLASVPVRAETREGVVRLYSDQTSSEHRTRAVEIARGVPGVTHVEDHMK